MEPVCWLLVKLDVSAGSDLPIHDGDMGPVGSSPGALSSVDPLGIWGQLWSLFSSAAHWLHVRNVRLALCLLSLRWATEIHSDTSRQKSWFSYYIQCSLPSLQKAACLNHSCPLSGGGGCLWAVLWFLCVSDDPRTHSRISKEERDYIIKSIGPQVHMKH